MAESTRERPLVKLRQVVEVRYKYLSKTRQDPEQEAVHEGTAPAMSAAGCVIATTLPRLDWLPDLLTRKMVLGLNLLLSPDPDPVKVLADVEWIEKIDEATRTCKMRLNFRDIQPADRNRIFAFQVRAQLPNG